MDRLTSMGVSNAALEFLKAAKSLRAGNSHLFTPTYFSICQSIELSLKAFLRGSGYTDKQLRKIGHDMILAIVEAQKLPLDDYFKISSADARIVAQINSYYQMKDLQYITSGFKSFPHIDELIDLGDRLWNATRDFAIANKDFHEGKHTEIK